VLSRPTCRCSQRSSRLRNGDHDRAIATASEAIRLDPKSAPAFVNRGLAYVDKGDNDRAITDHNEAIRLDPKNALAFASRGNAYQNKGDNDRAIADFNEAIRLNLRSGAFQRAWNSLSGFGSSSSKEKPILCRFINSILSRANLGGANLREADLPEANLRGANLRGASLQGAQLSETPTAISICPPAQRQDEIAALEREIDQLVRLDVVLVDCAADGTVHDAGTPPPALLQVAVS
jgi:tetratricopeptide (TPR) repeat protein